MSSFGEPKAETSDDQPSSVAIWYNANGYEWGYLNPDGTKGPDETKKTIRRVKRTRPGRVPTPPWAIGAVVVLLALLILTVLQLGYLALQLTNYGGWGGTDSGVPVAPRTYSPPEPESRPVGLRSLPVVP